MKTLKRGFTLIELMIVVAIIGLLAALAIPNFMRFQAKSKQSEARANLKAIFTGQKAYYGDKNLYMDLASVIGFSPEFNNRYAYYVGQNGTETRATIGNPTIANAASALCPTGPQGVGIITADEVKWGVTANPLVAPAAAFTARTANTGSGVVAAAAFGVTPAGTCCPAGACVFLAAAEGNIDNDQLMDFWSIGSQPGVGGASTCAQGTTAASTTSKFSEGEPVLECDDVSLQ